MGTQIVDIDSMPRGGLDASCLDRRLETQRLAYLDRNDVDDLSARCSDPWTASDVVRPSRDVRPTSLSTRAATMRAGTARGGAAPSALIADLPDPKILELGSGHGALARALLEVHPMAEVTVTDVEPT